MSGGSEVAAARQQSFVLTALEELTGAIQFVEEEEEEEGEEEEKGNAKEMQLLAVKLLELACRCHFPMFSVSLCVG